MNGTIHNQMHGTERVRFHYRPPQKVALTAFDRQRAMLLGIVVLFAVFALSFSSVYQNLTGFVTAQVPNTNYGVMAVPDVGGKNLIVSVGVDTAKVNGVYIELSYFCPLDVTECIDICKFLSPEAGYVTGKAWSDAVNIKPEEIFKEVKCVDKKLKFSDATLNNDKVKTGKVDLFSMPIIGSFPKAKDGSFTLVANPVNVYEVEKGVDLFPTQDYVLTVSLGTPVCGNNKCEAGEETTCTKDCKGITQTDPENKGESPGGSSSGSGSGCIPQWSCGNWGLCNNTKQQSRTCNDIGKQCVNKKPKIENQSCICQESWECSAWSGCVMGKNTRMCTDGRKCGTVASKPVESKGCQEVVPEYVPPPQQTYQPPMQQQYQPLQVTPPVVQKPEPTVWEKYKEWIVGLPMLLLFITILIITVLHFTKKQPQVTFNYDELKDWIKKERDAGTTDMDIELILAQNTGWTKEEVEKIFSEMAAGQKVEMPKVAS